MFSWDVDEGVHFAGAVSRISGGMCIVCGNALKEDNSELLVDAVTCDRYQCSGSLWDFVHTAYVTWCISTVDICADVRQQIVQKIIALVLPQIPV